jgi:hypothetical protein
MSYEEKGLWVYLVTTTVGTVVYLLLVLERADPLPLTEVEYAPIMLWMIGIAIGASIIGRILIEIARPSDGQQSDVRDRDIGRFGEYVGGTILSVGMVVPLVLAITEADHFWIAHAIYVIFAVAAIVGTTIKLIAYRRGF